MQPRPTVTHGTIPLTPRIRFRAHLHRVSPTIAAGSARIRTRMRWRARRRATSTDSDGLRARVRGGKQPRWNGRKHLLPRAHACARGVRCVFPRSTPRGRLRPLTRQADPPCGARGPGDASPRTANPWGARVTCGARPTVLSARRPGGCLRRVRAGAPVPAVRGAVPGRAVPARARARAGREAASGSEGTGPEASAPVRAGCRHGYGCASVLLTGAARGLRRPRAAPLVRPRPAAGAEPPPRRTRRSRPGRRPPGRRRPRPHRPPGTGGSPPRAPPGRVRRRSPPPPCPP